MGRQFKVRRGRDLQQELSNETLTSINSPKSSPIAPRVGGTVRTRGLPEKTYTLRDDVVATMEALEASKKKPWAPSAKQPPATMSKQSSKSSVEHVNPSKRDTPPSQSVDNSHEATPHPQRRQLFDPQTILSSMDAKKYPQSEYQRRYGEMMEFQAFYRNVGREAPDRASEATTSTSSLPSIGQDNQITASPVLPHYHGTSKRRMFSNRCR